ncbi:hypothetical protein FDP22_18125 (plasmid) [Paroceanicella profunda]|uniref:DUF3108 domain-containing protein n=1 Tax=Paroceanicella profunda TaxID=2579971 RepID=A0A5B8FIX7_9RHOB|nr:hypothetical protein [Paroceanicella profunda]QDL93807.1 hypothetical protein FDP22_18125 [Paroceanicella profunda]
MTRPAILALVAALALGTPAFGGDAGDLLFDSDALDPMAPGVTLTYGFTREGSGPQDRLHPFDTGSIELALRETPSGAAGTTGREALITLTEGSQSRSFNPFPGNGGNPVLMTFLESSVRAMAAVTGGSPFYIRNRFKDVLFRGGTATPMETEFDGRPVAANELTFSPFADDPNRARMGDFADLELRFIVSDEVPGSMLLLSAATPETAGTPVTYRERVVLDSVAPSAQEN